MTQHNPPTHLTASALPSICKRFAQLAALDSGQSTTLAHSTVRVSRNEAAPDIKGGFFEHPRVPNRDAVLRGIFGTSIETRTGVPATVTGSAKTVRASLFCLVSVASMLPVALALASDVEGEFYTETSNYSVAEGFGRSNATIVITAEEELLERSNNGAFVTKQPTNENSDVGRKLSPMAIHFVVVGSLFAAVLVLGLVNFLLHLRRTGQMGRTIYAVSRLCDHRHRIVRQHGRQHDLGRRVQGHRSCTTSTSVGRKSNSAARSQNRHRKAVRMKPNHSPFA